MLFICNWIINVNVDLSSYFFFCFVYLYILFVYFFIKFEIVLYNIIFILNFLLYMFYNNYFIKKIFIWNILRYF